VAQDVFLKLHHALPSMLQTSDLPAWLYRVTVNTCRDHGRRRKRSRLVQLGELLSGRRSAGPSPEDSVAHNEDRDLLQTGLSKLTERERAVIVLRDMEGLSTAEVAGILGSSESTVRVQAASARV